MDNSFEHMDLLEQSGSPCLLTSSSGRILYANPALEKLTRYPRGEILGSTPGLFRSGKTPRDIYVDLWSTISAGGCWRGELLNRKKTGEQFWEYICISPIRDKEQQIVRYLGLLEDRTEQKRKESERDRLLDTVRELIETGERDRMLPICSNCHSIRHANDEWEELAPFLDMLLRSKCTHGICPQCVAELYPEFAREMSGDKANKDS